MKKKSCLIFFSHGFSEVGSIILHQLSAKDQVALMQASPEIKDFILDNSKLRRMLVHKAYAKCPFKHEQPTEDISNSLKLLKTGTDEDLLPLFNEYFNYGLHDLFWLIFTHLQDKSVRLEPFRATVLHYLAANREETSEGSAWKLKAWIQSLPKDVSLCPVDKYGCTPLHHAVTYLNVEHLQIICHSIHEAKLFNQFAIQDKDGQTPLHYVMFQEDVEMVEILCQYLSKDQLEIRDNKGKTALDLAVSRVNVAIVEILCTYMSKDQPVIEDNLGKLAVQHVLQDHCIYGNMGLLSVFRHHLSNDYSVNVDT